ncbi:hypothetical protein HBI25_227580 [Parastagonospora nodorum]|nr:hypothetical protein HBH50_234060 [Parastagonospora nodorum]KAH4078475.1 hypothetical protein HBH48_231050 [Parastagonospora nodorum]KAH4315158.1 hypothetical protein HBI02_058380 [Parastagonospora nodorum]KAH4320300.1 hypothetical protein HBI00_229680 [Parastagonospora nodorum]KAH4386878.1 hypothetical protein HBH94_046890 [Parastagonospora nodorum]
MEEGAGGGNDDTVLAELLDGGLDLLDGVLEVGLPDVAAVDDTGGQDLAGAELADDTLELLRVPYKVNVDTVDVGEASKGVEVVDNVTEVGGDDGLGQVAADKLLVCGLESILDLLGQIVDEDGLVDLDGLGTGSLELLEELYVYGKELVEQRDGVDRLVTVGLSEGKEGDGADEDGAGDDASLLGLEELSDGLGVLGELEGLAVLEGRLDVVVV